MSSNIARRLIPLMDRVLVQKIKPETQTKSGLFIPDSAKTPTNRATVLAVGEGRINKMTGEKINCNVRVGDVVIVPEYGGMQIKMDKEDFHFFRDEDIIAIVKNDPSE